MKIVKTKDCRKELRRINKEATENEEYTAKMGELPEVRHKSGREKLAL